MATEREYFRECQVKRRRVSAKGGYESFWKTKSISDALDDADTEFRCKDCFGPLKLFKRRAENGSIPHVEHKLKTDSEYCPAGLHFLKATDGRQPRVSSAPVR
ncbi:MAG TPA: hypothetical protein VNW54_15285 [Granulicella sp.]|jgi:hypothetical protein|nr:hypothetical protein [Granulicella sp.]